MDVFLPLGKNTFSALAFALCLVRDCVAAIGALRFSWRGFGCATFYYLEEERMKKAIAFLLALVMVLPLAACGKSEAVTGVENAISAIGEFTPDKKAGIEEAYQAFISLSEKERSQVENLEILSAAREALHKSERDEIVGMLKEIRSISDYTSDAILLMWNNCIHSEVETANFATCYKAVLAFPLDLSKAEYDSLRGQNVFVNVWAAALAVAPKKVTNKNKMTDEAQEEVIDLCYYYNSQLAEAKELLTTATEKLKAYKEAYSEQYSEECTTLNDWFVELKLYTEFATEPTGSYNSYSSSQKEYQSNVGRYESKTDLW